MTIEVCAYSLESCINAQAGGAGRIELCGGLGEGGTTPSAGLIEVVKQHINIPVYVMIRPRGGDFVYDVFEEEIMKKDIALAKKLGADGVVLGILHADGQVNIERTQEMVEFAHPMKVTFHRAFDRTPDPLKALEDIIDIGCERILTSGQRPNVTEGADLIRELVRRAGERIIIMPGSGVRADNILQLAAQTGAREFHSSARREAASRMAFQNEAMKEKLPTILADGEELKKMLELLQTQAEPPAQDMHGTADNETLK